MLVLLGLFGCFSNYPSPLLNIVELSNEGSIIIQQVEQLDRKRRAQPKTPFIRARIASMEASREIWTQRMRHLSHWVYPVVSLDTEQCSRVGMMFRLPFSGLRHVGWIEPSIQEDRRVPF